MSRPSAIWDAFSKWLTDGTLLSNAWITVQETLIGFVVGVVAGFVVGFILGVSPFISAVFRPLVNASNILPRLALVPLIIVWFGLGLTSKAIFVTLVVFTLIFYNTYSGVRDVDTELIDVLRVMGSSKALLYARVILPSAMSWILTGLTMSVPLAMTAAVTAEMLASNRGLGYLLIESSGQFYTAGMFAAILAMVIIGLMLLAVVRILEKWLLRWKATEA